MGGYGMTPNVIAQISSKVDIVTLEDMGTSYGSQTKMYKTLTLGLCLT